VANTQPCRVVICDDQPGFREVVRILLSLEPHIDVVGEAANGREVLDLVERIQPDVLLLDVAMPELDGIEALPQVHALSPDTDVVIVTGFGSSADRERALAAGATRYVEKGADMDALVGEIRDACAV
jgi:DNA-binding NarL/FixJ family response regulator